MKSIKLLSGVILYALLLLNASCQKENEKPDPCKGVNCLNGGVCNDGTCDCPLYYEGNNCGTEVRQKYFGQFNGTLYVTSQGTSSARSTTISSNPSGPGYLKWDNMNVSLSDNNGNFILPYQYVNDGNEYYAEGTGTVNSTHLLVNFSITLLNGDHHTFTFIGDK